MSVYAVLKDLLDLSHSFVLRHIVIGLELSLKVFLSLYHAVLEPHEVTRHQTVYILEERHRLGTALE